MKPEFGSEEEKELYVQDVFTKVAPHYDLMNALLSFGMDRYWRRFAVSRLRAESEARSFLDVACGTCMLSLELLKQYPDAHVDGIDFNADMLRLGADHIRGEGKEAQVTLTRGDAMALPYPDDIFDGAISAFAMRNVPDVGRMIEEMRRVVKPGGRVVTLELAKPGAIGFKQLYYLYFEKLLPLIGKVGAEGSVYAWLPESLRRYPHQRDIAELYMRLGLKNTACHELTGGIVAVHEGTK